MPYFLVGHDTDGLPKWRVRVQHDGRRASRNIHVPERAAKQLERVLIAELHGAADARPETPTVDAFLTDRWLPHIRLHREPSTHARYRATVRTHVVPSMGERRLDHVRPTDIQDVLGAMAAAGRQPKTVHAARGVLSKAFTDAITWGLLAINPVVGTVVPTVEPPSHRTLSRDETTRLLTAAEGRPIEPLLHLAIMTGMRQGELLGARWAALDLDRGVLHVVGALKVVTGRPLHVGSTKAHESHVIDLSPSVVALLRRHRAAQAEHRLQVGEAYIDRDFIFPHPDGRPWHPQTLRKRFKRLLGDADISQPWPRWHDLRHTHATTLLERGHGAPVVAQRLGHASPTVTLKIYGHATTSGQRAAALDLDAWLYNDARGPGMDLFRPIEGGQRK